MLKRLISFLIGVTFCMLFLLQVKASAVTNSYVKQEGDIETFWVLDNGQWLQTEAKLAKINDHAYVYVQIADKNGNKVFYDSASGQGYITQGDVNTVAREFYKTTSSENIFERTRTVFGVEPPAGLDNETRITILLLDIDSDYANYLSGGVLWWNVASGWKNGYFSGYDSHTSVAVSPSNHSNERKIFYIDTYPTIEHGSYNHNSSAMLDPAPTTNHADDVGTGNFAEGAEQTYAQMVNNFQKMIHYYRDPNEEEWIVEGCSVFAEYINGYGVPESAIESFVADPSDSLIQWDGALADDGNSFLFILYLYEHFGGNSAIQNLVNSTETGSAGVSAMLQAMGQSLSFNELLVNWAIANYLDSDTLDFKYRYNAIDMEDYGVGDQRPGIDPISGSAYGYGFSDAISAEYTSINYDNKNYLTFTGGAFSPVIIKISNAQVVGIERDLPVGEALYLSDFGSYYTSMILVAVNTAASEAQSNYSYAFTTGATTADTIPDSKNREYLCFIATAAYTGAVEPSLFDKVIYFIKEILE